MMIGVIFTSVDLRVTSGSDRARLRTYRTSRLGRFDWTESLMPTFGFARHSTAAHSDDLGGVSWHQIQ